MKSVYDDTFEHHGIKGQKWGEKNGPPYPLEENSGSSSKHGGDKKKSGSSGKHRLLSLFKKRDKSPDKTKEISDVDRREMRNVFKGVFNLTDDARADKTIERYLNRANYDVQLAYNLLRWDLNVLVMTGEWKEHKPKDLPSNYKNYVDTWRSVNKK